MILPYSPNGATDSFTFALTDLMPTANKKLAASDLSENLKKYLSLVHIGQEALNKFSSGDLSYTDPLVGENNCQIRATIFARILKLESRDEILKTAQKTLEVYADKTMALIGNIPTQPRYVESFVAFLKEHEVVSNCSQEIAAIVLSYILTKSKLIEYVLTPTEPPRRQELLVPKLLTAKTTITKSFALNITKAAQTKLSELSVNFVQQLAQQLPLNEEDLAASRFVFGTYVKTMHQRKIAPCYPTMRLLLRGLFEEKIPLVFVIEQFVKKERAPYRTISLLYGDQGTGEYCALTNSAEFLGKGAVFFHTKSVNDAAQSQEVLLEKLLSHKITDALLGLSADHPQYGCDDTHSLNDPLHETYKRQAHEWGTCRDNPTLLMIEHIYCRVLDKELV